MFSQTGQLVNILDLADHMISVADTRLCHRSTKVAVGNMSTKYAWLGFS